MSRFTTEEVMWEVRGLWSDRSDRMVPLYSLEEAKAIAQFHDPLIDHFWVIEDAADLAIENFNAHERHDPSLSPRLPR